MKRFSWILTLVVTLAVLTGMFLASVGLAVYFDAASLVLVVLLPFFLLSALYTPAQMLEHFAACRDNDAVDSARRKEALVFFENFRKFTLFALVIPLFIGTTAILRWQWTDDPNRLSYIGKALGTLMLSAVYGTALLGLIILPRISALKKMLLR